MSSAYHQTSFPCLGQCHLHPCSCLCRHLRSQALPSFAFIRPPSLTFCRYYGHGLDHLSFGWWLLTFSWACFLWARFLNIAAGLILVYDRDITMFRSCWKSSIASRLSLSQDRSELLNMNMRPWACPTSLALSPLPQTLYSVLWHTCQPIRSAGLSPSCYFCTHLPPWNSFLSTTHTPPPPPSHLCMS